VLLHGSRQPALHLHLRCVVLASLGTKWISSNSANVSTAPLGRQPLADLQPGFGPLQNLPSLPCGRTLQPSEPLPLPPPPVDIRRGWEINTVSSTWRYCPVNSTLFIFSRVPHSRSSHHQPCFLSSSAKALDDLCPGAQLERPPDDRGRLFHRSFDFGLQAWRAAPSNTDITMMPANLTRKHGSRRHQGGEQAVTSLAGIID
jgi:hypothetical protein